jgi:hypothetical protein
MSVAFDGSALDLRPFSSSVLEGVAGTDVAAVVGKTYLGGSTIFS